LFQFLLNSDTTRKKVCVEKKLKKREINEEEKRQHSLPPDSSGDACMPRINLTFRHVFFDQVALQ
jgi:hypothetical protein